MASRAVDWSFEGTWPYEPRWFRCSDGVLHYVDEGPREGRPVLLVHGNPSWGYLFRRFIAALTAGGYRAIVPDHLGFGRSDKPAAMRHYAIARHADRLELLLESLDLHGTVVVPHDWGGPIALRWAGRHPDRVAGLFILNTLAHDVTGLRLRLPVPLRLFRLPGVGELLVQGFDAFKPLMLGVAIERRERITPTTRRAYRLVHSNWSERAGMLAFARQVPVRSRDPVNEINRETELALARHFRSKPARIVWGERDRVLPSGLIESAWLRSLPDAEVTRIPDAGHFLQEDAPERVAAALTRFVEAL